jgi:hypothetical protein
MARRIRSRRLFGKQQHIGNRKNAFLGEWSGITETLLADLQACGYTCDNLVDMSLLIEANNTLK